jgi:hypothetical protein
MDSTSYIIESSVDRELQGGKLPYTSTKKSEIIYDKALQGGNCKELNSPRLANTCLKSSIVIGTVTKTNS